ncbi:hypothetical protein D9M72_343530 [compost metagenome]
MKGRRRHRHRFGADGRTNVVGHVVGADVHGHVAGDRCRGDDDRRARGMGHETRGKGHAEEQKEAGERRRRQAAADMLRRLFGKAQLVEVFVDRLFCEAYARLCHCLELHCHHGH